ncbi:hypothetical protein SBA7_810009 [Candidatus Sulfotelmatobacter sp. SbA7]|nr:hypothetical protein SBA7_810009 [Candidatus Sulfotelmatobacter sp. SbA7]
MDSIFLQVAFKSDAENSGFVSGYRLRDAEVSLKSETPLDRVCGKIRFPATWREVRPQNS